MPFRVTFPRCGASRVPRVWRKQDASQSPPCGTHESEPGWPPRHGAETLDPIPFPVLLGPSRADRAVVEVVWVATSPPVRICQ